MPQSSRRLLNSADGAQRGAVGAGGEGGADLAGDHAEEGHRGGLLVGVVQRRALAGRIARVPAGVEQDVEEAGHREGGADRAEEEPCSQQHRWLDDALGPLARRSLHEAGLGGFAAEGEGRQRLGADVEGEELQHREREWDRAAAEGEDDERGHLGDGVGEDVEQELADVVVDAPARRDGDRRWWRSCRR